MIALVVVCTAIIAVGTPVAGWLIVPVVCGMVGFLRPDDRPVLHGFLAGLLGWTVLLAWGAGQGPIGELAGLLGGILGIPGAGVFAVTLLFPALLGASAGGVGGSARRLMTRDAPA